MDHEQRGDEGEAGPDDGVDVVQPPSQYRISLKANDLRATVFSSLKERAQTLTASAIDLGLDLERTAQAFQPEGEPSVHADPSTISEIEQLIVDLDSKQAKLDVSISLVRGLLQLDNSVAPLTVAVPPAGASSSASRGATVVADPAPPGFLQTQYTERRQRAIAQLATQAQSSTPASKSLTDFRSRMRELRPSEADLEDEELVVVGNTGRIPNKCPITGLPLENPRKNRACGHIYSLEGAHSLLNQQRGRCRCPVPGCNQVLTEDLLQKDALIERELAQMKRSQARQQLRAQSSLHAEEI